MNLEPIIQELSRVLDIKERLLLAALREGTMLQRDDPEFTNAVSQAEQTVATIADPARREEIRRILGHFRQFNPFNTTDEDENEFLGEVIEDFLQFSRDRIEKLARPN